MARIIAHAPRAARAPRPRPAGAARRAPAAAPGRAPVCAVVLAAGGSRRLGRPKQFVRLQGTSLLRRAVLLARAAGSRWIVLVTGAQAARAAREVRGLDVRVVRNVRWRTGLAGSLRAALPHVPRAAARVLVLTVDQWALGRADLRRLLGRCSRQGPVAGGYAGTRGVPAVFPRAWLARLAGLAGDAGARALLQDAGVRVVPLPRAALDLDTPADLARLRRAALRTVHADRTR